MDRKKIGEQLKRLRKSRGWRQYEVAEKVGLSRSAVSNIESGNRALTLNTLQKFCEVYQIDISYFGIETENFNETLDLTIRLEKIFNSESLDEKEKEKLYLDIMEIYLKSKK